MDRIYGPRWRYWVGVLILVAAGIEVLFRDYERATFLLVLGGLTIQGWWLGLLTDRVADLTAQIGKRETP